MCWLEVFRLSPAQMRKKVVAQVRYIWYNNVAHLRKAACGACRVMDIYCSDDLQLQQGGAAGSGSATALPGLGLLCHAPQLHHCSAESAGELACGLCHSKCWYGQHEDIFLKWAQITCYLRGPECMSLAPLTCGLRFANRLLFGTGVFANRPLFGFLNNGQGSPFSVGEGGSLFIRFRWIKRPGTWLCHSDCQCDWWGWVGSYNICASTWS